MNTGLQGMLASLLALAVLVSGIGVVYWQHQNRVLFAEMENLRDVRAALDLEWGQLQIEQSTYATHERVQRLARQRLGLVGVVPERLILLRPCHSRACRPGEVRR